MRSHLNRILAVGGLVLLVAVLLSAAVLAQDSTNARIQFVHAIPDAPAVDLYINDTLAVRELTFGTASLFLNVPAGDHALRVAEAGGDTTLWEQSISAPDNGAITFVALVEGDPTFKAFEMDLAVLDLGETRFTALNAVQGSDTIDVILSDGRPVTPQLASGTIFGTLDLPAMAYELAVLPTGGTLENALVPPTAYSLNSGTSYIMLVHGTPEDARVALVGTAANPPSADAAFLRLAHGIPTAGPVDVFVNNTLYAAGLSFDDRATTYAALPPGTYDVVVRPAGSDTETLTQGSFELAASDRVTVAVLAGPDGVAATAFPDDTSAITETTSQLNIINGLADPASVVLALGDGSELGGEIEAGAATATDVIPTAGDVSATVTVGESTTEIPLPLDTIYGGVYYNVLVAGGGDGPTAVLLPPVSFAATLGSAPGTADPVEVADAGDADADAMAAIGETTDDMSDGATAPPPQQAEGGGLGNTTSEQVALALTATAAADSGAALPEATPAPPEGDQPEAADSSLAQSEVVTNEQLTQQAQQAPPPALPEATGPVAASSTARVTIDPGANLQLRELPNPQARSLGLAPSGAVFTVNGRALPLPDASSGAVGVVDPARDLPPENDFDAVDTWLYITYVTPEGGSITAWVNAQFLDVRTPDGEPQRLADIPGIRGDVPGETRAVAEAPAPVAPAPAAAPTLPVAQPPAPGQPPGVLPDTIVAQVFLSQGANLHLRRNPSVQAESLALIPSGTQLIVEGRSLDNQWLRASYDGQIGWVSAQYVELSLEGQRLSVSSVPLFLDPVSSERATATAEFAPTLTPPPTDVLQQIFIAAEGVQVTARPGDGSGSENLPILTRGTPVFFVSYSPDLNFVQIQLDDFRRGWVPVSSVVFP